MAAQSVSGRMSNKEREQHLQAFQEGRLRVLCACDILNEGWDCPDIEVLLMARPTLSKVVYLQQLGRGTRKAPGKEPPVVEQFLILVECPTEKQQTDLLWRFQRMGLKCKALLS